MENFQVKKKPMTGAERIKQMRARKKAHNPQDYLAKERQRIAELRRKKKEEMTEKKLEADRKYERDRKRIQRAKAKINNASCNSPGTSSSGTPYRCKQTYSKALLRSLKALPKSPSKQKAVVSGLAKRVGIDFTNEMDTNIQAGSSEEENAIIQFYYRPDIVYTCPGIKDVVTVWQDGKKEKMQKHYLTMFLHEAFYIFKEENPNFTVGRSKFCSLRPQNVLLLKETPCDQCKCKIHENFILKLKGLKYTYDNKFWETVLCDDRLNSLCWQNKCDNCCNGQLLLIPSEPNSKVTWKQWKKNDDKKIKLVIEENYTGVLFEQVIEELPKMMHHVNTKRIQQKDFEKDKSDASKRILQIDFAMSFSAEYQNEIQSALWSRTSVLLFTAAVFCEGKCKTYLICSDTTNKDKDTILVFLDLIFTEVLRKKKNITEEVIWSDGPSSEFKNKYIVKALEILSNKHTRNITWKYFATSHGKGVVDGVGGNIKRLVRTKMMSQGNSCTVIQCAKDFAEAAISLNTKTEIFYVGEDHVEDEISAIKPWEKVSPIPGISSFHQVSYRNGSIVARNHALSSDIELGFKEVTPALNFSTNYEVGNWVLVNYEGTQYPGEIVTVVENGYKVSVMVPTSAPLHFKWPTPLDSIVYSEEEILKKIPPPVVVNSRGLFKFSYV